MKKFWLASAVAALSWTSIETISVHAATITYDFRVDLTQGTLFQSFTSSEELDLNCPGGISFYCPIPANETNLGSLFGVVGKGFFTFDDAVEPMAFDAIPLTSFLFEFDGSSFSLADSESPSFRPPGFVDGFFGFGIDFDGFSVSGDGPPPGDFVTRSLRKFWIAQDEFFYDFANIAGTYDFRCQGCVTYTLREDTPSSIPEPPSVFSLLALGILGMGSTAYHSLNDRG